MVSFPLSSRAAARRVFLSTAAAQQPHPHLCPHPRLAPCAWAAALACALASGAVQAQASAAAADAPAGRDRLLQEVVVTAVHDHSPVTVVADPKLPRQPAPASDAADYLKSIPGFSAIRSGGSNSDPVFRGQFGSRLPLLTNGTTLLGACPARMDAPSSYLSPQTYDVLTVVKGPQTVLWGPGASAGVVRFDRERPDFGDGAVQFSASALAGSAGRNDQSADLAGGPGRAVGWRRRRRGALRRPRHGRHAVPARQRRPAPGPAPALAAAGPAGGAAVPEPGRPRDGQLHAAALRARGRHGHAHGQQRAARHERGAAGGDAGAGRLLAGGGGDGRDAQPARAAQRHRHGTRPKVRDAEFSNVGVFGEATWEAGGAGRLVSGLRLDRAQARRYPASAGGTGMGTGMGMSMGMPMDGGMAAPAAAAANRRTDGALPSAFARWEQGVGDGSATWYAGLGHVQRFPDYWELISPRNSAAAAGDAFNALRPEKTTQLDVGAQWRGAAWQVWTSAYAGRVQDYILFDYGSGASVVRNVDADTAGLELGASYRLDAAWTLQGTLAYTWARNASDGRPLPQTPPLDAKLGAEYSRGPWSAGALWRLVAPQHRTARAQGNVVGRDFGPSAGFGVLSLHAGYALDQRLKLAVGVDNLLDKAYAEHLNLAGNAGFGYPGTVALQEPGRTLWVRADVKF